MKKDNYYTELIYLTISIAIVFGLGGFTIGKIVSISDTEKKAVLKTNCIDKEEVQEDISELEEETPVYEEEIVDNTPIKRTKTSLKEVKTNACKNMESKLNFSAIKNIYCCLDECSKDVNDVLHYSRYDFDENILHDIYNLRLYKGRILVIKNGVKSEKYYLGGISKIKSFRTVMDVSSGTMYLYVLDNKNNVYEYLVDDNWKKATDRKLVYKNVVDFDIFEGSLYKKCSNRTEGQDITIALHTTSGKTLFGRP